MRRNLNIKLLAILMGAVILVGGGVHALHGMQIKRSATVLLELVGEARKEDDLQKATDYLGRYLRLVPDDSEALAQYALLLGSEQIAVSPAARANALAVAEKALIHAPERRDLRRKAVDLALALRQFDAARSHLMILLGSTPEDGELALLLGLAEESRGGFEKAAVAYEKAVKHAPQQIEGYVRLADLWRRRLNQVERADQVMDAKEVKNGLIATNGQSFRAYLERAKYRKANGIAGADSDVARALALAPDEVDALLAAAESALDRGDLETARADLDRGLKRNPQDARLYQGLASLETRAGRFDEAIACLKRGLEALPGETRLQWSLAELLVQRGKTKEAGDLIKQLREEGFREEVLGILEARLAMAAEHWTEAITTLERVRTRLATQPVKDEFKKRLDLLLAESYRRIGHIDQQFNAATRAVAINLPDDSLAIPARIELASALSAMGRIDGAIDEYRKVLALPGPSAQARISLAQRLIVKNSSLPAPQRHWQEPEQLLDEAERTISGPAPQIVISRAEILAAQGRLDPARQLLEKARDQHPEQVEFWTTLAALIDRQGKPLESLSLLDKAQSQLGDRVELRLARGQHWERQGGPEAAEALATLEQGIETFAPTDRQRLLAGLAANHQRAGDRPAARRLWTLLAAEHPDNLGSRHALFDLALQAGDVQAMEQQIQDLRRIEGEEGFYWRFDRVRLTIQQARAKPGDGPALAEARRLLAPVVTQRPSWSDVARTEAELDDLANNQELALKNYRRAIELGDRSWLAFRRAVALLVDRGQFEEADLLMRTLQDQTPLSPELQRLAAGISLRTQDSERALALAHKVVSPESKDYREPLWLGQILWLSARKAEADGKKGEAENQRKEAGQAFHRAVALADDKPETWVALVGFLNATGQTAAAEETIREAEAALPKVLSPLVLARFYAALGRANQAEALYRDALKRSPDDVDTLRSAANFYLGRNRHTEAMPHLRRLIDLQSRTPDGASWARQVLAQLLAARGDYKGSQEALEILGLSATDEEPASRDAGATLTERRARANVLALQPIRSKRQEAIRILEPIVEHETSSASDLFLLGQLYDKDGDWPKAQVQLQKLLTVAQKQPSYPMYLAYFTRALIRHGEVDQARIWLGRLEQLQPDAPVTIELKARLLAAQKRGEDAAALLMAFVKDKDAQVGGTAAILEELGQPKPAEALYRRLRAFPGRPEKVLMLAAFLARHGRLPEALDLCEGAWKTCPAETVAQTCLTFLNAAKRDDAQIRRVDRWFDEAIRKEPGSIALQFDLATLRCFQERYDDAEAIYRRVAERVPDNAAPLNNLAWLIASRGEKATEALDYINRAIALVGPGPSFLDTRAVVSLAMGRSQEAIKDLEDVLATSPNAPMSYFHLAQARLMSGERAAAAEAFQAAKAAGLRVDTLHPLERPVYERLEGDLARK